MFENISADLRRYVKAREDCSSTTTYLVQFIPVVLFHEGALCMIGYRIGSWFYLRGGHLIPYVISKLFFFITGNYIHHQSRIGPGCKVNHSGVVIHAKAIGKGFECSANITIGQKIPYISPFPVIGDYVVIGAGARVLSDVGNEVIVGANAVVIKPVKDGKVVVGIPAQEVGSSGKFMSFYRGFLKYL